MPRTAKPLEVKAAKGPLRSRDKRPAVPVRLPGSLKGPPPDLGKVARDFWFELEPVLRARGQWSREMMPAFRTLCEIWEERKLMLDDVHTNGRFEDVVLTNGATRRRARVEYETWMALDTKLRAWLIEFGLTDASRAKVEIDPGTLARTAEAVAKEEELGNAVGEATHTLSSYGLQ